jgi:hypothetical protein
MSRANKSSGVEPTKVSRADENQSDRADVASIRSCFDQIEIAAAMEAGLRRREVMQARQWLWD